jgi:3D (Asp-Asp-Asp) domain-containing protein
MFIGTIVAARRPPHRHGSPALNSRRKKGTSPNLWGYHGHLRAILPPYLRDRQSMLCYSSLGRALVGMACGAPTRWRSHLGGREESRACQGLSLAVRLYLLKSHTTVLAYRASLAGALALLAFGASSGAGSVDATMVRAVTGSKSSTVQLAAHTRGASAPLSERQAGAFRPLLAAEPNPHPVFANAPTQLLSPSSLSRAGDLSPASSTPTVASHGSVALLPKLSSGSAPEPGIDWSARTAGFSRPHLPAPQARHIALGITARPLAGRGSSVTASLPAGGTARGGAAASDAGRAAAQAVSPAGFNYPAARPVTTFGTSPDRTARRSSYSLEHVLEHQVLAPAVLAEIARAKGQAGGLARTLQRQPDPSGLRLTGTRPGATQYLHWGQNPVPLASASAEATPAFARAGLTQPAPTPTPGNSAGSVARLPGGNANTYFITGYTATGSRTATGTVPHWGTVAVDRNVIPLDSTVYIQGLGIFRAEDTGGAVVGNHIDVFVNSAAEAYQLTGYRLVSFIPPAR